MTWHRPIKRVPLIPQGSHPGAFGTVRRFDIHTGVDLYCVDDEPVRAVEDGRAICVDGFTGLSVGSPWWKETSAIAVRGASGVVVYGELDPVVMKGAFVRAGEVIGYVKPVLPESKIRPDIEGHSNCMLHLELMSSFNGFVDWELEKERPDNLLDPTPFLLKCYELT
jgi:murein DD-endopeptidase MepM/ murein hydrolase activator NlpD